MEPVISARQLGKCYRMRGLGPPTLFGALKETLRRRPPNLFWALRDVSFDIPAGRTVGVIGPNGSGKSSLLGLVTGTIQPTRGAVRTHGRISSLLELGAGFHPDLTGRENVFLNAAILGIAREDIRRRMDAIAEFAGLGEFLEMPVKHYSSGMYVRLGFAVAVEVDPDILLIDEVLAVGDLAFQLRCLDRIRDFQRRGKTILLVSHALQTVEEFCHEALLIHHGRVVASGPPPDVILEYIRHYMGEGGYLYTQEFGTRAVEFEQVTLRDGAGVETGVFTAGQALHVDIAYRCAQRIERPVFGYSLKTGNGLYLYGSNTQLAGYELPAIEGAGVIRLTLDPLPLLAGNFFLSLSVHSWDHAIQYHRREDWYPFAVRNPTQEPGLVRLAGTWSQPPAG
ncbi:MAG: ABC transporter ATP-binding protein [Candidatus Marinimicrobia bacterium]|nr:ABC transporter ATP-binding protein [Candidatus Neomarinimicrobiota bacterium]